MASLYEIDERLTTLANFNVDIETGEYLEGTEDEFNKLFDEIQMDLNTKIEHTLCYVKDLLADVDKFKKEAKSIEYRAKQKEKLANRLQARIDYYIKSKHLDENNVLDVENLNKYKFETPKVKVSYRKSETVNILDIDKIPSDFMLKQTTVQADKVALKQYLKTSELEGARLLTNYNMQVK